jgi:hypothetical protein
MSKKIHRILGSLVLLCAGIILCFGTALSNETLTTKDFNILTWRHIGPFNFSGRITDFTVPKGQSIVYYVATATGGLWKTESGGIHFEPIFDKYGCMSMGHIAVAPSNPDILYLGTGEPLHARSSAHGNGMWKSTDAGKTWTNIGLKESYFIPEIAVDDKNPDIVYVACEGKLYDNEMDSQRGLYKTIDGGKTWNKVLDLKDRGVGDFEIVPTNSDIILAWAYKTYRRTWTYIDRQPKNFLYKSIDGGKTWEKIMQGMPEDVDTGRNGIAIYPKNPNIVYVRLDEEVNVGLSEQEGRAQYREGNVFRDGFYFNEFKNFKISKTLAKIVKFEPIEVKDEKALVKALNEHIKDRTFQEKIGIDIETFNKTAFSRKDWH